MGVKGALLLIQRSDRGLRPNIGYSQPVTTSVHISRQLVLFCVERRKAWRFLQSKAGHR